MPNNMNYVRHQITQTIVRLDVLAEQLATLANDVTGSGIGSLDALAAEYRLRHVESAAICIVRELRASAEAARQAYNRFRKQRSNRRRPYVEDAVAKAAAERSYRRMINHLFVQNTPHEGASKQPKRAAVARLINREEVKGGYKSNVPVSPTPTFDDPGRVTAARPNMPPRDLDSRFSIYDRAYARPRRERDLQQLRSRANRLQPEVETIITRHLVDYYQSPTSIRHLHDRIMSTVDAENRQREIAGRNLPLLRLPSYRTVGRRRQSMSSWHSSDLRCFTRQRVRKEG